jgi:hypothetical protein
MSAGAGSGAGGMENARERFRGAERVGRMDWGGGDEE